MSRQFIFRRWSLDIITVLGLGLITGGCPTIAQPKTAVVTSEAGPISNKLQREFNVRDYGAIGNDSTDDRESIQAALNAAHSAGGGVVHLPAGVYLISRNIINNVGLEVYSDTTLAGDGSEATTVLWTDDNATPGAAIQSAQSYLSSIGDSSMLQNKGTKDIVLRDFTVRFVNRVETKGIGVSLSGVDGGAITRVHVENVGGYSIYLARNRGRITRNVIVSDCVVTGFLDAGIELSGAVDCEVRRCTVTGEGALNNTGVGAAIYLWNGAENNRICDVTVHGQGSSNRLIAMRIDGYAGDNPSVHPTRGNSGKNIRAYSVFGGFSCTSRSFNNSLVDSQFFGLGSTGSYGIKAIELVDSTFSGCTFNDFDYTVVVSSPNHKDDQLSCIGLSITGCSFETFVGGTGAEIFGVTRLNFSNNRVINSYAYGVGFFGCREVTANNNVGINIGIAGNSAFLFFADCTGSSRRPGRHITANYNSIHDERETKFCSICVEIGGHTDYAIALGNDASNGKYGALPVVVTSQELRHQEFGDALLAR